MTQRGLFNLASNAIDSGAENKGISCATGRFFIFLSIFSKKREALCAVAVQQLATGAGL